MKSITKEQLARIMRPGREDERRWFEENGLTPPPPPRPPKVRVSKSPEQRLDEMLAKMPKPNLQRRRR